jgi:hypothetical protein
MSQQVKLKSLLKATDKMKCYIDSPSGVSEIGRKGKKNEASEQIVLYAGKLDPPTNNEKLRAHLQGMQWRVTELEKSCLKMQTQMTKIIKSRVSSHSTPRSLPKLCS